jgi:hypothetical protein
MTEIPEHLLKRRRAAKVKDEPSGDAGADSGASTAAVTPAATGDSAPAGPPALAAAAAAIPADAPPVAAAPKPHFIEAAESRKKMPMWAMFMLAFVPLWAVSFGGTMQLPDVEDPLFTEAAEVYNVTGGCSGCHGGGGGGGTGYQLSDGSVVETFPHLADQMVHVNRGSAAITGQAYGAVRADGQRVAGTRGAMPAATTLTEIELELVVFHERVVLAGEDTSSDEWIEYIEELRHKVEAGEGEEVVGEEYFELLLACSDPAITPGAIGGGAVNADGENVCPGPHDEE